MKWAENDIKFFFDGVQYAEFTPSSVPAGSWVFNKPFYVILAQGVQDTSGTVPADMLVDWVRVYQSRLRLHHLQRKLHRGRVAPDPKPNWH
jgi:beta-glucanase (GH16 family)